LRIRVRAWVVLCAPLLSACREPSGAAPPLTRSYAEPRWESVLDPLPELLVAIRPQALRRDRVYGPLLRRAIELAREHSRVVAASRALETIEDADEVIIGARDDRVDDRGEASLVIVLRGVRADVDPAKLVDDSGRPLWVPAAVGPVRELSRARDDGDAEKQGPDASLFELPGRTWVIASGKARAAARVTLAHPRAPTKLDFTPEAVAMLRLNGPALVARLPAFRPPGLLAAVGHELAAATVVLSSGDDACLRATLSYRDPKAVQPAEAALREMLGALSRAKSQSFAWLRAATTQAADSSVILTAALPDALTDALLHPTPEY
jgi:hypothetical protein